MIFQGNAISTTKYNILTFLPKGLFEQVPKLLTQPWVNRRRMKKERYINVSKRWEWPIQSDTQIFNFFFTVSTGCKSLLLNDLYFIVNTNQVYHYSLVSFVQFSVSVLMWKNVVRILGNCLNLAHSSFRFAMQFKRDKSPKMKTGVWDKLDEEHEYLLNSWKMEIRS